MADWILNYTTNIDGTIETGQLMNNTYNLHTLVRNNSTLNNYMVNGTLNIYNNTTNSSAMYSLFANFKLLEDVNVITPHRNFYYGFVNNPLLTSINLFFEKMNISALSSYYGEANIMNTFQNTPNLKNLNIIANNGSFNYMRVYLPLYNSGYEGILFDRNFFENVTFYNNAYLSMTSLYNGSKTYVTEARAQEELNIWSYLFSREDLEYITISMPYNNCDSDSTINNLYFDAYQRGGNKGHLASLFAGGRNLISIDNITFFNAGETNNLNISAWGDLNTDRSTDTYLGLFQNCPNLTSVTNFKMTTNEDGIPTMAQTFWNDLKITTMNFVPLTYNIENSGHNTLWRMTFSNCQKLQTINNLPNIFPSILCQTFSNCFNLTDATFSNDIDASLSNWFMMTFSNCRNITDISKIHFGNNINCFSCVFENCTNLVNVSSISNIKQGNARTIEGAFYYTDIKPNINISFLREDETVDISHAFQACSNLQEVNFVNGITKNPLNIFVSDALTTFKQCESLKTVNGNITIKQNGANTSYAPVTQGMFHECPNLITVPNFKVETPILQASRMFYNTTNLNTVSNLVFANALGMGQHIWREEPHAYFSTMAFSPQITNMFWNSGVKQILNFTIGGEIQMDNFCFNATQLERITGNIDLSNTRTISRAFQNCYNLQEIQLTDNLIATNYYTSAKSTNDSATWSDLIALFAECHNLSSFGNTIGHNLAFEMREGNAEASSGMYELNLSSTLQNTYNLTGHWNIDLYHAANGQGSHQSIEVNCFNFMSGSGISSVDVNVHLASSNNVAVLVNNIACAYTFENCKNLTDITSMSLLTNKEQSTKINVAAYMFENCTNLKNVPTITWRDGVSMYGIFSQCPNLTNQSLVNIVSSLPKVTMITTNYNLQHIGFTNAQINNVIATDLGAVRSAQLKGWNIPITVNISKHLEQMGENSYDQKVYYSMNTNTIIDGEGKTLATKITDVDNRISIMPNNLENILKGEY